MPINFWVEIWLQVGRVWLPPNVGGWMVWCRELYRIEKPVPSFYIYSFPSVPLFFFKLVSEGGGGWVGSNLDPQENCYWTIYRFVSTIRFHKKSFQLFFPLLSMSFGTPFFFSSLVYNFSRIRWWWSLVWGERKSLFFEYMYAREP